jgi:hypothetical protein
MPDERHMSIRIGGTTQLARQVTPLRERLAEEADRHFPPIATTGEGHPIVRDS